MYRALIGRISRFPPFSLIVNATSTLRPLVVLPIARDRLSRCVSAADCLPPGPEIASFRAGMAAGLIRARRDVSVKTARLTKGG